MGGKNLQGSRETSRAVRNASHWVRRACRANPSCHTHCLLIGAWGQQHWLKKQKSGEQREGSPAERCPNPGNEEVWDVGVILVLFVHEDIFVPAPHTLLAFSIFGFPPLLPRALFGFRFVRKRK